MFGRDGHVSIRPEKIHMAADGALTDEPRRAGGTVTDVAYLGSVTHFGVDLDGGGHLTVLRQNLHGSADQALSQRGQRVELGWAEEHVITLQAGHTGGHTTTKENS